MNKLDGPRLLVNLLRLIMLFINLQAHAQGGRTQTRLEQVNQAVRETQKLCEDQIENDAVPGLAIGVVFQDQVVCAAGFGVRDINTREPVNANTVFQLASLSKPIGSTVVAELVGDGKISWDSRVNELDPRFCDVRSLGYTRNPRNGGRQLPVNGPLRFCEAAQALLACVDL